MRVLGFKGIFGIDHSEDADDQVFIDFVVEFWEGIRRGGSLYLLLELDGLLLQCWLPHNLVKKQCQQISHFIRFIFYIENLLENQLLLIFKVILRFEAINHYMICQVFKFQDHFDELILSLLVAVLTHLLDELEVFSL